MINVEVLKNQSNERILIALWGAADTDRRARMEAVGLAVWGAPHVDGAQSKSQAIWGHLEYLPLAEQVVMSRHITVQGRM